MDKGTKTDKATETDKSTETDKEKATEKGKATEKRKELEDASVERLYKTSKSASMNKIHGALKYTAKYQVKKAQTMSLWYL
ncbi:hypothetical protein F8M41_000959 [Gigaspora margarita]|uniref:Uncharacterized protein n=1 Tax=Gigaspora margarita TaxID=4874 RepID=A0A8H4A9L0_GIGMA|nr:hypothetical protein F8M41_000959 [Gigaspora margarita]